MVTIFCWFSGKANAQQSTVTRKIYLPNSYLTTLRADYYFKNKAFLYLKAEGQQDYVSSLSKLGGQTDQFRLTPATEWRYTSKWYQGVALWLYGTRQQNGSYFYLNGMYTYIGHRGLINRPGSRFLNGIEILKEFLLERQNAKGDASQGSYNPGLVQLGFKVAIVKPIKLNEKQLLRPAIGLQIFRQYYDNEDKNPYKRFIDESRFRFDINYLPNPNLVINLFAMRRTQYLPIKDNTNLVYPTYGFGISYYFDRFNFTDKILKNY